MQKVLRKRIIRDLKSNLARYIALAFLVILSMYLVVSLVGAAETIIQGSRESDRKSGVEDGQFSLFVPMKIQDLPAYLSTPHRSFSHSDDVEDEFFQEYWDRTIGQKDELQDGIQELLDGSKELTDGLDELSGHNDELKDGAMEIFDSYLSEANSALIGYGVGTLTADNFESVLQKKIDNESSAIVKISMRNLLKTLQGLQEFSDGIEEYTDGTKEAADGSVELQDGIQELKDETDDMIDEIFNADASNLLSFVKAADNVRIRAAAGDQELNRSVGTIAGVIILILIAYVLSVFVVHQYRGSGSDGRLL